MEVRVIETAREALVNLEEYLAESAGARRFSRRSADLMLVGETPGDREDLEGRPFVGPAGRELDQAFEAVGLDRRDVYVTNAVKHFKWTPSGKRRLHQKPSSREIAACRPWLSAELSVIEPEAMPA